MDDSIVEFVKSVIIKSCRVSNTPHLVFLCGGITAPLEKGRIRSARDYFYRHVKRHAPLLAERLRLAEKINDWFDQDTFEDLLELEGYLADTSDLIILFVESPGSLAELGAFATTESLRVKTLAVLNSIHPPEIRSFISDGPVRRIRRLNETLVRYFKWNERKPSDPANVEVFEEMSKELTQYALERVSSAPKERTLNKDSDGHTMYLVADLVNIIGITTEKEIIQCLKLWGYDFHDKKLSKYLSLLEHLSVIRRELHSDQTYYLSEITSALIKYDFNPDAKVRDRDRIKALIRSSLSQNDEKRMKVFKRELLSKFRSRRHHV